MTGVDTGDKHSEDLFRESIASLKRNKLGLKGVVPQVVDKGGANHTKVFCTLPSKDPVTSHSMSHYVKNLTFTLLLSSSRTFRVTRHDTITWTSASFVRTRRESILVWSTSLSRVSSSLLRSLHEPSPNVLQNSLSVSPSQTTELKSHASTKPTS